MIPIKIDGKSYVIPTSWQEVPVKMYFELDKCFSDFKKSEKYDLVRLYSILLDIDYQVMFSVKQQDVYALVDPNIKWIKTTFDLEKLPIPKKVNIKGKEIAVPKDLELESFGQNMAINTIIKHISEQGLSKEEEVYKQILHVNAIYFYKQITGESLFNFDDVEAQLHWIEQAPICQMYPVSVFFLVKSGVYQGKDKISSNISQKLTSFKQGLKSLIGTNYQR